MKVKEVYARLRREPAHWSTDLEIEIHVRNSDGNIRIVSGHIAGLETDLEDSNRLILRIKEGEE